MYLLIDSGTHINFVLKISDSLMVKSKGMYIEKRSFDMGVWTNEYRF